MPHARETLSSQLTDADRHVVPKELHDLGTKRREIYSTRPRGGRSTSTFSPYSRSISRWGSPSVVKGRGAGRNLRCAVSHLAAKLRGMDTTFGVGTARRFVAQVRWRFAATMPKWPHEYTVREWERSREEDFESFVRLIRECGETRPWPRGARVPKYHHIYFELEGWQYWTMGAPISETTVINRAVIGGKGAA